MGYAYDESPFVPLRTTQSGTTVPTPDMKDAEIAKLRADVEALKTALAAYQSPEAAHALALRVIEQSQRANRAEAALSAARAALDGEREACDRWRKACECMIPLPAEGCDVTQDDYPSERCSACLDHDARRAAEAKP